MVKNTTLLNCCKQFLFNNLFSYILIPNVRFPFYFFSIKHIIALACALVTIHYLLFSNIQHKCNNFFLFRTWNLSSGFPFEAFMSHVSSPFISLNMEISYIPTNILQQHYTKTGNGSNRYNYKKLPYHYKKLFVTVVPLQVTFIKNIWKRTKL